MSSTFNKTTQNQLYQQKSIKKLLLHLLGDNDNRGTFLKQSEIIRKYVREINDITTLNQDSTHYINFQEKQTMDIEADDFMQKASPEQIETFFSHCQRVKKLIGEQMTMPFFNTLFEQGALLLLNQMSDQQIIQNCPFQTSEPNKKLNMMEVEPNSRNPELLKHPKMQQMNCSPNFKNKKQESEPERFKRELSQHLKANKTFTTIKQENLQQFLAKIENYIKTPTLSLKEISTSAGKFKGVKPNNSNIFEFIRIVDSALYHSSDHYRLREMQILALMIFLVANSQRMLLEILTGQGKSTTISCLAAILAISGCSVDIVTTNQLLAKRDVEEKAKFYSLIGLQIDHNFQQNQRGEKKCYTCPIVYGTPHTFQVDILLNDYKKRGTRCNRPYHVLIVDEVDSMFVDQKDHQTLLSTIYPGFSQLFYPMQIIWNRISMNPVFKEENKLKIAMAMGKDQTLVGDIKTIMQEVIKDIRKQFQNQIIPKWRMEFIDISLEKWIDSAIAAAFVYQEKKHYLVKDKKIVPVDYKNNGALQENVHWENGLHQFLQIKHGLPITTEGLTSNFISNLGHFDKYPQLYGLTGTLGSDESKFFLKQTYMVELFKIPPSKKRRLEMDPGHILYNDKDWANYIADQIAIMIACERSVLVLCESIQEVDLIKIALQSKMLDLRRIQLLRMGSQKIDDKIHTQEVILATNLAGRGADLKITEKLNERGGLHVIIGFMPTNSRVQMQGRGRAGRNGYPGSSQLAINYEKYCQELGLPCQPRIIFENSEYSHPMMLCQVRNEMEKHKMKQDSETVQHLRAKDRVFNIYCKAMNQIPDFQTNSAKQKALEEKWAMFLKRADIHKIPYDILEDEAIRLTQDLKNGKNEIYNPNHYVERGINQLCENKDKQAIGHFQAAQKDNAGTLPLILGGLYQNSAKINQAKEDKGNIQSCLQGLNRVQGLIEHRKEIRQGFRLNNFESQKIANFHAQQLENVERQFSRQINNNNDERLNGSRERIASMANSFSQVSQPIQNLSQISTGEDRVLNGLSKAIEQIKGKYSQLGKNQYVEINFEGISNLLPSIEGDQTENKEALDKLQAEGLMLLPKAVIKKKKVSFWKRLTVFLLGIAQIFIGAIIVASTAGALTNFGVTMMMEGAKYCFDSIFRPQLLEDLGKYLTNTAMKYAFALATSGIEGIKELGTLSQKGFKMFQSMPIGKFLQTTLKQAGIGIEKVLGGQGILGGGLIHVLSHGLLNKGEKNNIRDQIENPISYVQKHAPQLRQKTTQFAKDQAQNDTSIEQIRERFEENITKQIKKCIASMNKDLLNQIKNLPMQDYALRVLINGAMKQGLNLPSTGSKQSKDLVEMFAKQFYKEDLAQKYCSKIKLSIITESCLKNVCKQKNYESWVQGGLKELIFQSLKSLIDAKKAMISTQSTQLQNRYNSILGKQNSLTLDQYNNQVNGYKAAQNQYNQKVNKFNDFVNNLDHNKIFEAIKQRKGIEKGRLKPNVIAPLPVHQFTKEALNNLKYIDSSKQFEETLADSLFNVVGNFGLKIIDKIYSSSGGTAEKLEKIAKMMKAQ